MQRLHEVSKTCRKLAKLVDQAHKRAEVCAVQQQQKVANGRALCLVDSPTFAVDAKATEVDLPSAQLKLRGADCDPMATGAYKHPTLHV